MATQPDPPVNQWRDAVPAIVILSVALIGCVLFTAWLLNERGIVALRLDEETTDAD